MTQKDEQYFLNQAYNLVLSLEITEEEREKIQRFRRDLEAHDRDSFWRVKSSLLPLAVQGKLSPEVRQFFKEISESGEKHTGWNDFGGIGVVIKGI